MMEQLGILQHLYGTARECLYGYCSNSRLVFGGFTTTSVANTEEYNSTIFSPATGAWASGGNMGTARFELGSCGTQTAALGFGGYTTSICYKLTEEYDGRLGQLEDNIPVARFGQSAIGTQTAALGGGLTAPTSNVTEEYDGTSWSIAPGNLNTARRSAGGAGTQNFWFMFGGYTSRKYFLEQQKNIMVSAWTAVNSMNTGRFNMAAFGTQTAAIAAGGEPGATAATESWNGTSWTTVNSLNVSRSGIGGAGIKQQDLRLVEIKFLV
jgi:WD40 repeat protein